MIITSKKDSVAQSSSYWADEVVDAVFEFTK
jgi:hypothetical protein